MPYFDQVKAFCLFLATGRSGHSIMAHLLTAHPKVMICDELGAVSFFKEGYSREQVFALIKFQDFRHQRRDRKKSGYTYKVDGAWQNVYEKYPEVIGDAKGTRTIGLVGGEDDYLENLRSRLAGVRLRFIVHLRNPFDALSTMVQKRGVPVDQAVDTFLELEKKIATAYFRLDEEERLLQRHEDVVADPEKHFINMFEFLGVEPLPDVVKVCAGKIWKKPNVTRKKITWPKRDVERLESCIRQSPIYSSYLEG